MTAATYYLSTLLKKTRIKDEYIPFILTTFAIILVFMGEIAMIDVLSKKYLLMIIKDSVVKGLVVAMLATYMNQIIKKKRRVASLSFFF